MIIGTNKFPLIEYKLERIVNGYAFIHCRLVYQIQQEAWVA